MEVNKMKDITNVELLKTTPAIGGTVLSAVTLNEAVMVATLGYIILQACYLAWKWRREAYDHKRKRADEA